MAALPLPRNESHDAEPKAAAVEVDDQFVAPGRAAAASPALALQDQLHHAVTAAWKVESTLDAPAISRTQLLTIIGCACGSWGVVIALGWAIFH